MSRAQPWLSDLKISLDAMAVVLIAGRGFQIYLRNDAAIYLDDLHP